MFNQKYNFQYNSSGINEIKASVLSVTKSTSTAQATVTSGVISKTTSHTQITYKLEHHVKEVSQSISESNAKPRLIISNKALSGTQSSSVATYLIRKRANATSSTLSQSKANTYNRIHVSGISDNRSYSTASANVYSYAPPVEYRPIEQTPIWIYDKDEQLQLVLLPRNQTSDDDKKAVPYTNGWYIEQINGRVTLSFEVPSDNPDVALIEPDGRAVIRDQDGELQEFIIRTPEDSYGNESMKIVSAEGAEYELIDEFLPGYKQANVELKTALTAVLQGTRWSVGEVDNYDSQPVNLKDVSVKKAVYQLTDIFGGERKYRIEASGNTITNRYIDILPRRGENIGKRFEAGKDIVSASRAVDTTGIKTALYGRGASGENDGPRLDFSSVEWSKVNGDPCDKPLGQTWVGDEDALHQWGYHQGTRHRFGMYDSQEGDPGELLLNTWNELQTLKDAVYTYEQDVILLEQLTGYAHEKVRLGDSVNTVIRKVHPPIETEETIIEFRQNLNDPAQSKVTLGNFRQYFDTNQAVRNTQDTVNDKQGNWDSKPNKEDVENEAQKAIDEAQKRIDAAKIEIDEAIDNLAQTQIDITDAQALIDDTLANPQDYEGQMVGDIIADSLIVRGPIIAQDATITGTLVGSNATFLDLTVEDATIIDANIQNATITGTLASVSGTFTGDLVGGRILSNSTIDVATDLRVGNNISLGQSYQDNDPKEIEFSNSGGIMYYRDELTVYALNTVELNASHVTLDGYNGVDVIGDLNMDGVIKSAANDRLKLEAGSTGIWIDPDYGTIYFRYNGQNIFTFYSDGSSEHI